MLSNVRSLLRDAERRRYAVGAFNIGSLESLRAIVEAADAERAPVIIQTSGGETRYLTSALAVDLAHSFAKRAGVPVALHLDHSKSFEAVKEAVQAGYTSVHIDGSILPHEENIALTRKVVKYCKSRNIFVEGEIGHIGGSSVPLTRQKISSVTKEYAYTEPEEAEEFVRATGINSLAITFGNAHGIFAQAPKLDFQRLSDIRRRVKTPLVLHGGSGIRTADFKRSIKLGIRKVNMNTELRIAYYDTLQEMICRRKDVFKPYEILPPTVDAMRKIIQRHMRTFGSTGKARKRRR